MTPTCVFRPTGQPACGEVAVAEFYQGGPDTIGYEPCWEPRCAEHIRISTGALRHNTVPLDEGGFLMGIRALSPACAGCGHTRVGHVYGCKGTRQSGGPNGMTQRCPCPRYAATKAEAVTAR